MPNHAPAPISTLKGAPTLDVILQNHKSLQLYGATGCLFMRTSFGKGRATIGLLETINIFCQHIPLTDPVKAGLVSRWQDWSWTYIDGH